LTRRLNTEEDVDLGRPGFGRFFVTVPPTRKPLVPERVRADTRRCAGDRGARRRGRPGLELAFRELDIDELVFELRSGAASAS
jgi:hypothetical protein